MGALVLLPPLPPEEVARGQASEVQVTSRPSLATFPWQKGRRPSLWFHVIDVVVEVRMAGERRRPTVAPPAPLAGPSAQANLDDWSTSARVAPEATPRERRFEYQGAMLTASELAKAAGLSRRLVVDRLYRGYSVEQVVTMPVRSVRSVAEAKERERAAEEKRYRELVEAGVFDRRPVRGNGVDGDCLPGPCGFVSCRHHLFIEVDPIKGTLKMNFPGKEIDEIGETCSLRAARAGGMSDREVAAVFQISHQRVHQIEAAALAKMREAMDAEADVSGDGEG